MHTWSTARCSQSQSEVGFGIIGIHLTHSCWQSPSSFITASVWKCKKHLHFVGGQKHENFFKNTHDMLQILHQVWSPPKWVPFTLPKTNKKSLWKGAISKGNVIFQPLIFRCYKVRKRLVSKWLITLIYPIYRKVTLPETNIAHKNGGFQWESPVPVVYFQGLR